MGKMFRIMIVGYVFVMTGDALAAGAGVTKNFRDQALQAENDELKNSAFSPVPVEATSQPGYIRSTTQGNLAAYSNAESYSTFQMNETRAQFLIGDAYLLPHHTGSNQLDIALRYRLSPRAWPETTDSPWHLGPLPLSLSVEVGAIPASDSNFGDQFLVNTQLQLHTSIKFNYEAHIALIDELPHGRQNWIVPEVGAGFSDVSTTVKYSGGSLLASNGHPDVLVFSGETTNRYLRPYFSLGAHLFADHFISLNLQGNYVPIPFPSSVALAGGTGEGGNPFSAQTVTVNAPTSTWALEAQLQMKLVWPTLTHTPLLPQMMPPWLLPSYTTDEISPWVASPEVTQRWNQPGRPSVGNVMFQYKNRWAKRVEIIGEFNDWASEPMIKDRSGIWVCVKDLPVGKFRYNYVIDGTREIRDPWNKNVDPDSRKGGSSLVVVK